jgi:hypothetical protein
MQCCQHSGRCTLQDGNACMHTCITAYCIHCCFKHCSPSNLSRSRPATPTNGGSSSPHVTPRGASSPSLVWRQQAAAQLSGDYQSYPFGKQSDQVVRAIRGYAHPGTAAAVIASDMLP